MRALVFAFALATATLTLSPGVARADDAQGPGRALFTEGVALFNEGKYFEACNKLEASLRAYPGIGTRGKLAECYEKSGRFVSAWTAYREVAQLAMRSGDPTREQVASERAKALEPKLSYVTISLPRGADTQGLVVKRNGIEIDRARFGAAEALDAGTIDLEVAAPGRKGVRAQVVVAAGQRVRFEVPALEAERTAPADDEPARTAENEKSSSWQKPVGLAVSGVGVVLVGMGAFFGLSASGTYDDAFNTGGCNRTTLECNPAGQDVIDDARTKATISTISFISGGVLAIGGMVLFFTAPKERAAASSASRPRSSGLRITPATFGAGGGLVVGGAL